MTKILLLFLMLLLAAITASSQTIEKKWGFGAGASGYLNLENSSLGLSPEAYLSRYLTPSFDLMANVTIGYFGNKNVNEPLDMFTPSLNLRYKLYNDYIMPIESKFQPYLYGGVGYMFDNARDGINFNVGGGVK